MMNINTSQRVIVVSPLGYAITRVVESAVRGILRHAGGSRKRRPMHEIIFKVPMFKSPQIKSWIDYIDFNKSSAYNKEEQEKIKEIMETK
jgi:hypothetical protein